MMEMIKGPGACAHAREHAGSGVSTSLSLRDKITALSLEKAVVEAGRVKGVGDFVVWQGKQPVADRFG